MAMSHNTRASLVAQDDDKHYKMCKKIAQLTKVIYTLNNKTEDNEQRTEWLHGLHRQEIAELCQEYESQIERLQQQIRSLQADKVNIAASLEKSQRDQLQEAQEEFKMRIAALSRQVSEQESKYDSTLREDKQRMAAELAAETKRVRDGKDAELAVLIREYNDKYKAMLAEQLDLRDALEEKLNREWSMEADALRAELAAVQGSMNTQVQSKSKLLQDSLQRCAMLSNERDQLVTSLEKAESQVQMLQGEVQSTQRDLQTERRLRAAVNELKSELESRMVSLEAERDALEGKCAETQQSLTTERALSARQAAAVQSLENEKASLSTSKEALAEELEECKAALTASVAARDAAEARLRDLGSASAAQASSFNEAASQLSEAKSRIASLEQALLDAQQKFAEEVTRAKQSLSDTLLIAAEEARISQAQQLEGLSSARAALESAAASEQQKLMNAHADEVEELKRQHYAEVQRLQADVAEAKQLLQKTTQEAEAASAKVTALTARCEEQGALLQNRVEESGAERHQLEQQLQELQCELDALRIQAAEAAAQASALERVQAEQAASREAADAAHAEALREVEVSCAAKIKNATAEYAAMLKSVQEQHKIALQGAKDGAAEQALLMRSEVEAKIAAQKQSYADKMAAMSSAAADTAAQLSARISELQAELYQARGQIEALQASNSETALQQQREMSQLQGAMAKAQEEAAAALSRAQEEAAVQRREEAHHFELLRQRQVAAERERYEAAVAAHKEELAKKEARSNERLAAAEAHLHRTIETLEATRVRELRDLADQHNTRHQKQLQELGAERDAERSKLQRKIDEIEATIKELTSSGATAKKMLEGVIAQRDQILQDLAEQQRSGEDAITAEKNRRVADMEQLRVAHARETDALVASHKGAIDSFSRQQAEEREAHQALVSELHSIIEKLQYKYDYRESRPEDVELINKLLREANEKEQALKKAYEDLRLYKLELINREENYNKVFSRQPTVADYSGASQATSKGSCSLPGIGSMRKQATR